MFFGSKVGVENAHILAQLHVSFVPLGFSDSILEMEKHKLDGGHIIPQGEWFEPPVCTHIISWWVETRITVDNPIIEEEYHL
jgi:hypothetical protein